MPSASAYSQSPGRTHTPWISTATSRWPSPRFSVGKGIKASARIPTASTLSSATSRTHPSTTMPAQPLRAAALARLPPTNARRKEPPPSTTSTRPSPGESTACLTHVLSSNTFTVLTGPQKAAKPPKALNTGGRTRNWPDSSFLCSSQRSQVLTTAGWEDMESDLSWHVEDGSGPPMPVASPPESIQKRRHSNPTSAPHERQTMLMGQSREGCAQPPQWALCPPIAGNPRPYWLCGHTDATESTEKYAFSLGKPFFLHYHPVCQRERSVWLVINQLPEGKFNHGNCKESPGKSACQKGRAGNKGRCSRQEGCCCARRQEGSGQGTGHQGCCSCQKGCCARQEGCSTCQKAHPECGLHEGPDPQRCPGRRGGHQPAAAH